MLRNSKKSFYLGEDNVFGGDVVYGAILGAGYWFLTLQVNPAFKNMERRYQVSSIQHPAFGIPYLYISNTHHGKSWGI
jgi:hypothetical protein